MDVQECKAWLEQVNQCLDTLPLAERLWWQGADLRACCEAGWSVEDTIREGAEAYADGAKAEKSFEPKQCESCGTEAPLHKAAYADESAVGSMMICDSCEDRGALPPEEDRDVTCQNCDARWKESQCKPWWHVHHLHERMDPGEIVPVGECPDCKCWCHLPAKKVELTIEVEGGCVTDVRCDTHEISYTIHDHDVTEDDE